MPLDVTRQLISLRAYDAAGMLRGADAQPGAAVGDRLAALFADARVASAHLHNAKQGCFSCAAVRA